MPAALNLLPHGESPERAVGAGGGGGARAELLSAGRAAGVVQSGVWG